MSKNFLIAIDGPAGSGKSTIAKLLAQKLGFIYLDTGAMYRAITYFAILNNLVESEDKISAKLKDIKISLKFEAGVTRVILNDEDVTDKIRTPSVNNKVSEVSKIADVRKELVRMQREIGENNNLVTEGRDTTTVVFPNADVKIFLTASLDERTNRRYKEFVENKEMVSLEDTRTNLAKRDMIDSSRINSPLTKAIDAIEIDSTNLSIDEEVNLIFKKIQEKLKSHNKTIC